jgi:DNA repair and recombination protein RAD52
VFDESQQNALSLPLNPSAVKTREQAGQTLSYVEGWYVIDQANTIFGFDGWHRETVLLQESSKDLVTIKKQNYKTKQWEEVQQWRVSYIAKVRITVGDVIREGIGFGSGMGKPENLGDAIEGAVKEAETDAMKRALMTFGNQFGLCLYDKKYRPEQSPSTTRPPANRPAAKPAAVAPRPNFAAAVKDHIKHGTDNGLTVARIKEMCKNPENALPDTATAYTTQAQVDTLAQLIEDEIAKLPQVA